CHVGGARRRRAAHLFGGVHARRHPRHHRRRPDRADGGRLTRHGGRVRGRGVRRCGHWRARLDARRAGRGAGGRAVPRVLGRALARVGGAGDLRDRHRRPAVASRRSVRKGGGMKASHVAWIAAGVVVALVLVPSVAPSYYASLMIPFFGYAIALLGFNLLFGYTGLLSFGHAMFLGFGAYGAA